MNQKVILCHDGNGLAASCRVELYHQEGRAPRVLDGWKMQPAGTRRDTLFTLGTGTICREEAWQGPLRLVREIFRPEDGRPLLAVRLLLTNTGAEAVQVEALTPVFVEGEDLALGGLPASEWVYLRQPRHKNDLPAAIVLGSNSPAVWDAVRGTPETGGLPKETDRSRFPTRFVSAELTLLHAGQANLLFGAFPLDQQLVQTVLELTPDRHHLARFRFDCQCDGCLLPPEGTLCSQWVLVEMTEDPFAAMEAYRDLLLAAHPVASTRHRPGLRAPTVWFTWYYFGAGCAQWECDAMLEALKQQPLPFDIFQIDYCWSQVYGDWEPNARWPNVATYARKIREAGYEPGLWTAPFLAEPYSTLRHHKPHWLLKYRTGQFVRFPMGDTNSFVLDPTHPEVLHWLECLYRRLVHEWGYTYQKLDFTRCVGEPNVAFFDPTKTRAQAYRMGIEAVRRGMGEDAYLCMCGGFYGPSIGLVDSQRTGSDVKPVWYPAPAGEEAEGFGPFYIKQNALRFWMNGLWHNDPDPPVLRRRQEMYRGEKLSLGLYNDDEVLTLVLNVYIAGGMIGVSENLAEIEEDRLLLLRHCIPSHGVAAIPRDALKAPRFPSLFHTAVRPAAAGLRPWHTLAVINWHTEPRTFRIPLDPSSLGEFGKGKGPLLVSAFKGRWVRKIQRGEILELGPIPPHGCEVLKIQEPPLDQPCILRTDGHFSMGGTEVTQWQVHPGGVQLTIEWPWPCPLEVVLAPPRGRRFVGTSPEGYTLLHIQGPLRQPTAFRGDYEA